MTRKSSKSRDKVTYVANILRKHFGRIKPESLVASGQNFPVAARVDLQGAVEALFNNDYQAELAGFHARWGGHQTITFSDLLGRDSYAPILGPLLHDEVDIGEVLPARCLSKGIWLGQRDETPFAFLLAPQIEYGRAVGTHVEIAVPPTSEGTTLSRALLDAVDLLVKKTASYRGKVISLQTLDNYSGTGGAVRVHRLHQVSRDEVILPEKTLGLLERNVIEFVKQREQLKKLGMPVKKGLLFYGPPGTGKTHTIHYLASRLSNHTTLLITAEQVGLLDHYFQLARFLQPSMIVLEDVDLIARSRDSMHSACEESMLNKLLNEMDGLREDAAVLFVLTTNRPEHLEAALSSRPGRIDQAIEFPLPDEQGRAQLIRLYACGLQISDELISEIVERTKNASAAFIKELMRRSAQFHLREARAKLSRDSVNSALEEMLFSGGSLNLRLLGVQERAESAPKLGEAHA